MSISKENINDYIIKNYPETDTNELAARLNMTVCALRSRANRLGIKKDDCYMNNLYNNLQEKRKENFEKSITSLSLNQTERNIIIGSLLGDGSFALYGRSKNAHYREHGGNSQIDYRKWKAEKLKNVGFKFNNNCKYGKLSSISHPIYTELYNLFYINGVKTITQENISLLDHPIGLACLYMDDGSLIINSSSKVKDEIYIFPQVLLYSLSFSLEENIILKKHIDNQFDICFDLKKRPDGQNYILNISRRNELMKFIELVSPYVKEIDCMRYKVNVEERLLQKRKELAQTNIYNKISIGSLKVIDNGYSQNDEYIIICLKKKGCKDKEIAEKLNKTYWGTVDKIRRLRQEGRL
ncbi:hypothetical protein [Brassicibacter mesophilus]|uniref:hypothetical protein n=1 Tax=Brassicibacter mesophilus TaxID=745119 RepID=UPI003D1B9149